MYSRMSYVIGSKIAWFPSCTEPFTRPELRNPYLASASTKFGRDSPKRSIWRSFLGCGVSRYASRSARGRTYRRNFWTRPRPFWIPS